MQKEENRSLAVSKYIRRENARLNIDANVIVTNLGPGLAPTKGKARTLGAGITGSASEPWLVVDVVGVDGCSKDIIEMIFITCTVFSKLLE